MTRLLCIALLTLAGCGSDGGGDTVPTAAGAPATSSTSTTPTTPPTHDVDIQPIWEKSCGATCHINDDDGGLQLGNDAYDQIVGVASDDVPTMNLIEPGSLDDSYLWRKLDGTHIAVGGEGFTMPRGSFTLKKRDKNRIEAWILDGAPR